jgi:hypothetical protein
MQFSLCVPTIGPTCACALLSAENVGMFPDKMEIYSERVCGGKCVRWQPLVAAHHLPCALKCVWHRLKNSTLCAFKVYDDDDDDYDDYEDGGGGDDDKQP